MSGERLRARLASLSVLLGGGLLLVVLAAPAVTVLGHRGAVRLGDGFRPGRWDARFLEARAKAALIFPDTPLRVTLRLSGPARLTLRAGGVLSRAVLGSEPIEVEARLPAGGRIELEGDATLRLHEFRVARTGEPPWARILVLLAVTLLAAGTAWLGRAPAVVALSPLAPWLLGAAVLHGTFPGLVAAALFDRGLPVLSLAALAASPLLLLLAPRGGAARGRAGARELWLPAACGALLFASCLLQIGLYQQPLLVGDLAAYHDIAGRFRDALRGVGSLDALADALQELRPYGGLALTGLVYGALRSLRDQLSTVYIAHSLAIAGCGFFLVGAARRLGGTPLAALTGVLVLSYGTLPVRVGLVQPEPFVLLLWAAAFSGLLAALERGDERGVALSGLGFALGLALQPQGIWFPLLALVLVLLPFARLLAVRGTHRLLRGFALGLLPVAIWTAAGEAYARPVTPVLDERHGFRADTAPYPLAFWLLLETDGWQGPLRVDDSRYARELRSAELGGAAASGAARALFTARFVAANAGASLRTLLRNLHRLWDIPDNPPRRDFPLPYSWQVAWHRALVALFLLGAALALPGRAAFAYVPFAILSASYPVYQVFDRYAVPATPFLLLGAALALRRIASERRPALLAALLAAGVGAVLAPASLALAGVPPLAARVAVLTLHLGGLALAFRLAWRGWARGRHGRLSALLAALLLIVPALAAEWNDPAWRSFSVRLEREAEHEIALRPEEIAGLNAAREACLVLDLRLPSGDPSPLELRFASGLALKGAELQPCMPRFALATTRFHRDPRTFRQWWRVAWRPEMAQAGRVRLTVLGDGAARLYGALADPDASVDRGPSLGQWPYLSISRLMHDGEYRLAVDQPLRGLARASRSAGSPLPGRLAVRLVELAGDTSLARVETAPVPAAARAIVTAVWARTSPAGVVDLELPRETLSFRLEDRGILARGAHGPVAAEVRFVATGEAEGFFLVRTPAPSAEALILTFRPRQEMASPPRFLAPELRALPPIPLDWTGFPYVPVVKVLESRAEPWRPEAVY